MMNRADAEAHWEYTEMIILKMLELVKMAYIAAMLHGAKHESDFLTKGD